MSENQASFDRFVESPEKTNENGEELTENAEPVAEPEEWGPTMKYPIPEAEIEVLYESGDGIVDRREIPDSGLSLSDVTDYYGQNREEDRPDRIEEWAEKAAEFGDQPGSQEVAADGGEESKKFDVRSTDGVAEGILVKTFDDREDARDHAEKMNTIGNGTDLTYYVEPVTAEELEDREDRVEEALETIQDSADEIREEENEVSTDGGQQMQKPQKTLGFDPEEETVTQDWEGEFLSTMWGYNQTNVDFVKIVDVSGTGKTVLARKTKAEQVDTGRTSKQVRPIDDPHGDEFRLHVRESYNDEPVFRGSYPLGPDGDMDDGTRKGGFDHWGEEEESIRETATNYGH